MWRKRCVSIAQRLEAILNNKNHCSTQIVPIRRLLLAVNATNDSWSFIDTSFRLFGRSMSCMWSLAWLCNYIIVCSFCCNSKSKRPSFTGSFVLRTRTLVYDCELSYDNWERYTRSSQSTWVMVVVSQSSSSLIVSSNCNLHYCGSVIASIEDTLHWWNMVGGFATLVLCFILCPHNRPVYCLICHWYRHIWWLYRTVLPLVASRRAAHIFTI